MAMIPAMSAADFGTGGTAVMNYGMQIGKDLAAYGEKIGLQIKDNRDKQQAMGSLPALQEAMQAFQAGQSGAGYSSIINLAAQDPSNPYVQNLVKLGMMGGTAIDENRYRMRMADAANARASGTATGYTTDVDPEEAARRVLLGDNAPQTFTTEVPTNAVASTPRATGIPAVKGKIVEVDLPRDSEKPYEINFNEPVAEVPASPQKSPDLSPIIKTAKSPAFQEALKAASKKPPSPERVSEYQQFAQQYNQQPEEQKQAIQTDLSIVFPSYKDYEKGKQNISPNYFPLSKEQTDVIGDNITGLVLSPSVKAESTSTSSGESKSGERSGQSIQWGTDRKALEDYQKNFTGAASELSEGEIGKFLKKNGGVFNTTYSAVPKTQDADKNQYTKDEMPERVVLYNKNSDRNDPRTEKIELTKAQLVAYKVIKDSPAEMQRLRSRNSESSYVRIAAAGPTKETSKGLPVIRTGQRKPINTIFGQ